MKFYSVYGKRGFDLAAALCGLIILSPLFVLLFFSQCLTCRGQPFFFQSRPGKGGRIFRLVKFRTMNDRKDRAGRLLPDSIRMTPVGKLMRKTSLDELPQLINVLKGDMSLIGPRPLLVEYLDLYTARQARRHEVRPGITGWAQVNGRNTLGWEEKFDYDIWYVDHISFALDRKILWRTIKKVFDTEGISQQGHATMPYFKGTNNS
jgi:undecaprenyl phosphate N,N'-diacetylbacillosamine 1-phosphate transferase